jgi:hypothetical protein
MPGINNTKTTENETPTRERRIASGRADKDAANAAFTRITRIRLHDYEETLSRAAQLDCAATHDEIVSKIKNNNKKRNQQQLKQQITTKGQQRQKPDTGLLYASLNTPSV